MSASIPCPLSEGRRARRSPQHRLPLPGKRIGGRGIEIDQHRIQHGDRDVGQRLPVETLEQILNLGIERRRRTARTVDRQGSQSSNAQDRARAALQFLGEWAVRINRASDLKAGSLDNSTASAGPAAMVRPKAAISIAKPDNRIRTSPRRAKRRRDASFAIIGHLSSQERTWRELFPPRSCRSDTHNNPRHSRHSADGCPTGRGPRTAYSPPRPLSADCG